MTNARQHTNYNRSPRKAAASARYFKTLKGFLREVRGAANKRRST